MGLRATGQWKPRNDLGQFVRATVGPAVLAGVTEACDTLRDRTKELCPVRTGMLRDSYTTTVEDTGKTVVGVVSTDVYYAPYVEFGTGIRGSSSPNAGPGPYSPTWPGMEPRPHFRPALDDTQPQVFDIMANDLRFALK